MRASKIGLVAVVATLSIHLHSCQGEPPPLCLGNNPSRRECFDLDQAETRGGRWDGQNDTQFLCRKRWKHDPVFSIRDRLLRAALLVRNIPPTLGCPILQSESGRRPIPLAIQQKVQLNGSYCAALPEIDRVPAYWAFVGWTGRPAVRIFREKPEPAVDSFSNRCRRSAGGCACGRTIGNARVDCEIYRHERLRVT